MTQLDWITQVKNKPFVEPREYIFNRIGAQNLVAATPATMSLRNLALLVPFPSGITATSAGIHYLRITDSIAGHEQVLLTAVDVSAGTVTFTPALNHTAGNWQIMSASTGIQEAIMAASAFSAVLIPAGIHYLYATVTKPATQKVSIRGMGSDCTLIRAAFAAGNAFYFDAGYSGYFTQTISGLHFVPILTRTSGSEVYAENVQLGAIFDIVTSNCFIGFTLKNFNTSVFSALRVSAATRYGVQLLATGGASCGGLFTDIAVSMGVAGIAAMIASCDSTPSAFAGLVGENIVLQGGQYNLFCDPLGGNFNEWQLTNLQLDGATDLALALAGTTGASNTFLVNNCRISPAAGGSGLSVGRVYTNVALSNFTLSNTTGGTSVSVKVDGGTDVALSNFISQGFAFGLEAVASSGQVVTRLTAQNCSFGGASASAGNGLFIDAAAHVGLSFAGCRFAGVIADVSDGNTNKTQFTGCFFGSSTITYSTPGNYIATETGSNNAIAGALVGAVLQSGLTITVKLAHTLQVGANTFALNGGAGVAIKSAWNPANNIATAVAATATITLLYDPTGPYYLLMGQ
jgi:hypothetical protein